MTPQWSSFLVFVHALDQIALTINKLSRWRGINLSPINLSLDGERCLASNLFIPFNPHIIEAGPCILNHHRQRRQVERRCDQGHRMNQFGCEFKTMGVEHLLAETTHRPTGKLRVVIGHQTVLRVAHRPDSQVGKARRHLVLLLHHVCFSHVLSPPLGLAPHRLSGRHGIDPPQIHRRRSGAAPAESRCRYTFHRSSPRSSSCPFVNSFQTNLHPLENLILFLQQKGLHLDYVLRFLESRLGCR